MKKTKCENIYSMINFENKTVIIALGAKHGGAKTILEMYYNRALKDNKNDFVFIISSDIIESSNNIDVIVIPLTSGIIAKVKAIRIVYFSRLSSGLKKAKEIISLDNILYGFRNTKNTVYLHQALPYEYMCGKRYLSLLQTLKMLLIKISMQLSIIISDKVVVQTYDFKAKIINSFWIFKFNLSNKIIVEYPLLPNRVKSSNYINIPTKYIYPTNSMKYKNIEVLIKSLESISNYENLEFLITLNGDENNYIKKIKETVLNKNYPIKFIGKLNNERIYELYSDGYGLFFSSKVESFGLPILEAISADAWILAYKTPTTKEILNVFDYKNYNLFNNDKELSNILNKM